MLTYITACIYETLVHDTCICNNYKHNTIDRDVLTTKVSTRLNSFFDGFNIWHAVARYFLSLVPVIASGFCRSIDFTTFLKTWSPLINLSDVRELGKKCGFVKFTPCF